MLDGSAAVERQSLTPVAMALLYMAVVTAGVVGSVDVVVKASPLLLVAAIAVALHRKLFAWRNLLAVTVLVILLIPIRRYELPGSLPFKLEPYRLIVAFLAAAWLAALLVDRRTKLRRTILDVPLLFVPIVAGFSVGVNPGRLEDALVSETVWKTLTFLVSYIIFYYVLASVIRTWEHVDFLVHTLVGAGAVVAFFTLIEARTQWNAFDHLSTILPGLTYVGAYTSESLARGGHIRALGSAQHPIALSAMLAMLVPIGVYLAVTTNRRRWWAATVLIMMAVLATLSRTGVVMLLVIAITYAVLRPGLVKRLAPYLVPALVVIHFALPGTIGSFKDLFFPQGGLVAEQDQGRVGSSRGASRGPALQVVSAHPVLGEGYGTRITADPKANAFIVDNGWLGTAMETGLLGVFVWVWLFVRAVRRMGGAARADPGPRGWLLTGTAASVAAFAVSMFTYDAFSFIQSTFVLFLVLALGAAAVAVTGPTAMPESRPSG